MIFSSIYTAIILQGYGTTLYFPGLQEWHAESAVMKLLKNPKTIKPCESFVWLEGEEGEVLQKNMESFFLSDAGLYEFALLWAPTGYGKTELAKHFLSKRNGPTFYFALRKASKGEDNFWRLIGKQFGLNYGMYSLSACRRYNIIPHTHTHTHTHHPLHVSHRSGQQDGQRFYAARDRRSID